MSSLWYLSTTIFTTNPWRPLAPQAHCKNTLTLHLLFSTLRDKMTFRKERFLFFLLFYFILETIERCSSATVLTICIIIFYYYNWSPSCLYPYTDLYTSDKDTQFSQRFQPFCISICVEISDTDAVFVSGFQPTPNPWPGCFHGRWFLMFVSS